MKMVDETVIHIVRNGMKFSFVFCLIASYILQTYCEKSAPEAFYIGISLIKSCFFFAITFIICGFVFDKMAKKYY